MYITFHTSCHISFQFVNNKAQALCFDEFIKEALFTLPTYWEYFGLEYSSKDGYTVTDRALFDQWKRCTGVMVDEFWLLNLYLLHLYIEGQNSRRPTAELKAKHMGNTLPTNDKIIVAEVQEYRDSVIQRFFFSDLSTMKRLRTLVRAQHTMIHCYNELGIVKYEQIANVLTFLRAKQQNALFFRFVQML